MHKQFRLMIVDNCGSNTALLANMFSDLGLWTFIRSRFEEDILHAVRRDRPDVILLGESGLIISDGKLFRQIRDLTDAEIIFAVPHKSYYTKEKFSTTDLIIIETVSDTSKIYAKVIEQSPTLSQLSQSGSAAQNLAGKQSKMVTELLEKCGFSKKLRGFHYLRDAILYALDMPSCSGYMTQKIYPEVADKNNSTPARVERSIRHAINRAFEKPDVNRVICPEASGKQHMSNSEFIACAVEWLRAHMEAA